MNEENYQKENIESETAENSPKEQNETEEIVASILPASVAKIADALIEQIEPVIAPVEEIIKEKVIEPILETLTETKTEENTEETELPHAESSESFVRRTAFDPSKIQSELEEAIEGTETVEAEELDVLGLEALPELPRGNRARLNVQSPNRIFLYWSVAGNPFATANRAFGNRGGNYTVALRLLNLSDNKARVYAAGAEGSWWFDVASGESYRVDIGLFAENRPFIRLFSSNDVSTPRSKPSSRVDTEADWRVSNVQFAQVLDASGYGHDSLPVVFGFDGGVTEDTSTIAVLNEMTSNAPVATDAVNVAELRWLLSALAAGASLEYLRERVSAPLAAWIETVLATDAEAFGIENVRAAMQNVFGEKFSETFAELDAEVQKIRLQPVFGLSSVHFPEVEFPRLRFPQAPENFSSKTAFPTSPARP